MPAKAEIRKKALDCRKALSKSERREKNSQIFQYTVALPQYQKSQTIMVYLNFRDEVETSAIAGEILRLGKRLLIPLCSPKARELTACEILDLDRDIHPGMLGLREPHPERRRPVLPKEIDLVLVPGVAFDFRGNRIGYGQGYYDRLLPHLREDAWVIGLAFSCQVVEKIEPEEHDFKMALLVTEKGIIYPE